jgi:hypothetical protein
VIEEDKVSNPSARFIRFYKRFSGKSALLGLCKVLAARRLWALSAVMAGVVTLGCGSPSATLQIGAPSSVIAGSPFTITVTAMAGGRLDTIISTPIYFTSSDSAAILPVDYRFTAADAGSHTFTNGVTLMTAGTQSITATDTVASSISGTVNVTVSAATTPLTGTE